MTKVLALTGATGTLGRAVAWEFLEAGWKVEGGARHEPDGGDKLFPVANFGFTLVDAGWSGNVAQWMEKIAPVDAVVTCAGVSDVAPSLDQSLWDWEYVVNVNLSGTFYVAREAVRHGAKRVVTVGSIHGCTPTSYPERAAYTASKAGVAGLTVALAVEWAKEGVSVNCIAPGHLPAMMQGTGSPKGLLEAAAAKTPTGRLTTPKEVAQVIKWLVTEAPPNMTGQIIVVDGGFSNNTFPK